ncbi:MULTISPECIES: hypothetical protein [Eikenella]|uniref:Uncharacterized protein n=1 Tax=Eikenella longinqua TaxID=1795827 RepID=A0A1A9S0N6_9NEIS|nr:MULTISPECIES: hypothetical protein [Eikenella]OAM30888.1 hypothetical protein A7P95_02505 [Eikenella longinqua]
MADISRETNQAIKQLAEAVLDGSISREAASRSASALLGRIESAGAETDPAVFSFLQYIEGWDTPDFEREYLFCLGDFAIEFDKVKDRF